ncbi:MULTISPECIES: hypothetical protein [Rhodopirellula]|uniref:hypothetical protein n=1 Tax=Rhodopirellula TaxID=265488 RepID=UPI002579FF44|nr:hypothetical protein [Rhodopirellula sp. UBA1907]
MATKQAPRRTAKKAAPKAKAAAKPKTAAKTKPTSSKPKGTGVIATIIEVLSKATKTKPVTKDALLTQLEKRFPDRAPEAMKRTINCQVPSRLLSDKQIKVQSNDAKPRGYWIA